MKKFTINCDFNGQKSPFTVFIGKPQETHHPLHFQAEWLSSQRGGSIPPEVMESVSKIQELAKKNGVSLEDLCVYAIGSAEQDQGTKQDEPDDVSQDKEGGLEELSSDRVSTSEEVNEISEDLPEEESSSEDDSK